MKSKSLLGLILIAGIFIANSGGQNANRAGAPGDPSDCGGCHEGGGIAAGNIQISGLPAEYIPEETYSMSITVNEPNASPAVLSASGFQIVATNAISNQNIGSFTVTDSGTRLTPSPNNRLVQSTPRAFTGTSATWNFNWTAPSADNFPEEITFFFSGNSVDEGGSFFDDVSYFNTSSVSVVPVNWSYVNAFDSYGEHTLNWGTETEVNNSHFELERSYDGVRYELISKIDGAGESFIPQHYEFIVKNASVSLAYYRVKQVDYNGDYAYSETVIVKPSDRLIEVYPTEVHAELMLRGFQESDNVKILDLSGKQLLKTKAQSRIDMLSYSSGLYIIQILDERNNILSVNKIIKQ